MVAASGDSGSEAAGFGGPPPWTPTTPCRWTTRPPSPTWSGWRDGAAERTPTGEGVWNDCQGSGPSRAPTSSTTAPAGGGISANWDMPSWQVPVENGQSSGIPCANGSGNCREGPDVSADAALQHRVHHLQLGFPRRVAGGSSGGTSAAAPLWAAAFALLDEGCASPVGMATPALYTLGEGASSAFNDVTVAGNNDPDEHRRGGLSDRHRLRHGTGGDPRTWPPAQRPSSRPGAVRWSPGSARATDRSRAGAPSPVSGSSLATVSAVHFGPGLEAQVLSASATAVTVVIPAAPAPEAVDVTVTTPAGTSGVGAGRPLRLRQSAQRARLLAQRL